MIKILAGEWGTRELVDISKDMYFFEEEGIREINTGMGFWEKYKIEVWVDDKLVWTNE